ncbi:glycosyltransferase (plasmid) [Lactiplantibacillus plantarum]|uniref:glycosyltransferase n=1 Tax=Lactiplantibacillus plantarum TaxID=1590 RepID=UPI002ACBF293|nr:glycosyltransferase [Lactiplantibacillus plantarum]WQE70368.1 glycosyltransferase [Lactiplantibacillus plantarum]
MKRKKILLVANTASMIYEFNLHNIAILQSLGAEVHVATNFVNPGPIDNKVDLKLKKILEKKGVMYHQVDFMKGIGNHKLNVKAMKQLCQLCDKFNFDGIHAQSPLGGIIARRVAHRKKVHILYTAHGFQFFKGGPFLDWLIFFPVEWFYGLWTDALVTINTDDYAVAKHLPIKRVYYIPGVGTDIENVERIAKKQRQKLRQEVRRNLGINDDEYLLLSVGELSERKNHATVIKAISKLNDPKIKYVIAGIGDEETNLKSLIKENRLENKVQLLGYQTDLDGLYFAADLNVFISKREGLGLGGLDGVAHGLYIIGNGNTGMKDYIKSDDIGLLVKDPTDVDEVSRTIAFAKQGKKKVTGKGLEVVREFDYRNVNKIMKSIYQKEFM